MEKTVGKTDKIIRVIVALITIYLGWKISPWFYIITIIALVTAITGMCPLYSLLKLKTNKRGGK